MNNTIVKKILFALGVLVSLVVLSILFLLVSTLKKSPPESQVTRVTPPKDSTTVLIESVEPVVAIQLTPGSAQKFSIVLDPSVDIEGVRVSVTSAPVSNLLQKSSFPITTSVNNNILTATTNYPITPVTAYTLTLIYQGKAILQQSYLSAPADPTPVPTNNSALSAFLPYSTLNYLLEYNKSQNVYIVHFKYDLSSKKDLSTQLSEAKKNAFNFIQSKGVDPSTITIIYSNK